MAHEPINRVRAEQRPPQRHKIFNATNRFDFDRSKQPADVQYEWKACKVAGMENEERMIQAEQNGWEPVPASRHPELVGLRRAKEEPNAPIIRGGQMLMQQPLEYYQQSREMDKFNADHTVESQIVRLGLQARRNGAKGIGRTRDMMDIATTRRRTDSGGEIVE